MEEPEISDLGYVAPEERATRRYQLINSKLYSLLAIPLFLSTIALLYLVVAELQTQLSGVEELTTGANNITTALVGFGLVYIAGTTYLSYLMYRLLHEHLYYSSLEILVKHLESEENEYDIVAILAPENSRQGIPAPSTALIINLLTGGLAFPFLLYVFEKRIRQHDIVESRVKGYSAFSSIDISNLLLDLVLTFITIGLWLVYWIYRALEIYNRHVEYKHYTIATASEPITIKGSSSTVLPLLILSTAVYSFLSLNGIPSLPLPQIMAGFLFAYAAYTLRDKNLLAETTALVGLQYLYLALFGLIGYLSYGMYSELLTQFEEVAKGLGMDFPSLVAGIYLNNVKISLVALIPYLGPAIAGYAIGNTSFIFGLIVYEKAEALTLFITPHTLLEFLSYGLSAAIASRIPCHRERLFPYAIASLLILFIGALVESALIIYGGGV